jgi:hypothetical protein
MVKLRFEIWKTPHAIECAAVSDSFDRLREPDAHRVEVFYASTWDEAMTHHYERQGWGLYTPMPDTADQPFTEDQLAEQKAYLDLRPSRWRDDG